MASSADRLLDEYSNRVDIASNLYKKSHNDVDTPEDLKKWVARSLSTSDKYFRESGTSHSRFCMNLTNAVLPSLISTDFVEPVNISGLSRYLTYVQVSPHSNSMVATNAYTKWGWLYKFPRPKNSSLTDTTNVTQLMERSPNELVDGISDIVDASIIQVLLDNAELDKSLNWDIVPPTGVSIWDHYESFISVLERSKSIFQDNANGRLPSYILIPPTLVKVFTCLPGFVGARHSNSRGFFPLGSVGNLKVYVASNIEDGTFTLGLDAVSHLLSAAYYGPNVFLFPNETIPGDQDLLMKDLRTSFTLDFLNPFLLLKGKVRGAEIKEFTAELEQEMRDGMSSSMHRIWIGV